MSLRPLQDRAGTLALAGLAAAALLVLVWLQAPGAALAGWLAGFLVWSGVAIGALVLVMVRVLTGGRAWGEATAPALAPAAATLPTLCLLFLPVALGLEALYPWARDPAATAPDVARLYLNAPAFLARSAVALAGWSALAILLFRHGRERPSPLAAALGLAFHGVAVSLVALDWVVSTDPAFVSTSYGAELAITQVLAALAWAALVRPAGAGGEAGGRDVAGLTMAALLGVVYLAYMQFVVSWYGDLPEKAAWYLRRGAGALPLEGWGLVMALSFLIGALLPFLALLLPTVRGRAGPLRVVGALVLAGLALRSAWLVAPGVGPWAGPAAALGVVAVGGLWAGLAYGPLSARLLRPTPPPLGEAARGA